MYNADGVSVVQERMATWVIADIESVQVAASGRGPENVGFATDGNWIEPKLQCSVGQVLKRKRVGEACCVPCTKGGAEITTSRRNTGIERGGTADNCPV